MRLEFRHLELIVAIAETGSLRKAAAALSLTQPAVTTQLQRIEKHLGGPLFVRSTDGVLTTETGTGFIRDAKALLDGLNRLERTAQLSVQRGAGAPIRVGGVPAHQFSLLVNALATVLPGRECSSRTIRETGTLRTLLGSGELDIAVLREFPGFPLRLPNGVEHRLLLTEPIFTGVSENHRLAGRDEIPLAELGVEKWVMPHPDDSGMNEFFARTCTAAGFEQRVTHLTNEAHIAFALTAEGGSVCVLYPIGSARQGLATLPLIGNPLYRGLVLAWRADSVLASTIDDLCAEIARGYLELVQAAPVYAEWWHRGGADFALP
ncbi:MAG: LysR family transcriptional regulator [Amycolatopsis sp.]|uniref:LysR family transcriptional regulator n=1 Tax=Amycolatopsis sp. TaxID=37632 RepID=UPI0026062D0A|nr:LysR family transcriptional regulator [Amycolatopsis sp.]MCU1682733.1 LysR family transcriptional regulator [Amycolatopsis sp.]